MKKSLLSKGVSLAAVASVFASLAACGPVGGPVGPAAGFNPNVGTFAAPRAAARAGKKQTVLMWLAADNNLYSAGLDDLNEMEFGLNSDQVDLIVMFDGAKQGDSAIYKIKHDAKYDSTIISEKINDGGAIIPANKEVDSGDPKLFAKFIDWGTKNFPSEHNSVVIWNHGSGIYRKHNINTLAGAAQLPKVGSFFETVAPMVVPGQIHSSVFAIDDNGGEMNLRDLNPALGVGVKNLGKPFDVLDFDACLMGHVETAYQVSGLVRVLTASQELEPGDGNDYVGWIKALSANPDMDARANGAALVDAYAKSYMPGGSQRGSDVTKSATDIDALVKQLVPALKQLGAEMSGNLPSSKPTIDKARETTQVFYNADSPDLGHFLKQLGTNRSPAAASTAQALSATVVKEGHVGSGVANATGLSIYFPKSTMGYNKRYDDANDIRFAETQAWGPFLHKFTGK